MNLDWYFYKLLRKLGFSESKSVLYQSKIIKFEEWISRYPITNVMITFDPKDCLNEWKELAVSIDDFKLVLEEGRWRKHFVWKAHAKPTEEVKNEPDRS